MCGEISVPLILRLMAFRVLTSSPQVFESVLQ